MAHIVQRRVGSRSWRLVGGIGWLLALGGTGVAVATVVKACATSPFNLRLLPTACIAFGVAALGALLIAGARRSDTRGFCSECGHPLQHADDKACTGCRTVFG